MNILDRLNLRPLPTFAEPDAAAAAGTATQPAGSGTDTVAAGAGSDTTAAGAGDDTASAGAGRTALEADPGDKGAQHPADFPADWREKLAGTDTKALERLKRMQSPSDLWKSFDAADKRINSGKAAADEPMPDPEKKPAEAKAWRAARGIPDEPTGYAIPEAVQKRLSDADKPVMAAFHEFAHAKGVPQQYAATFAEFYVDTVEAQIGAQKEIDNAQSTEVADALRTEWGAEYKANTTLASRYAKEAIPDVPWFRARIEDGPRKGQLLGNQPEVIKALAKFGAMEFGDGSFVGGEARNATLNRKAEIEKMMKTDFGKYDADPALKKEYFDIIAAEEKASARGAAPDSASRSAA
jgi:hypothetical protein